MTNDNSAVRIIKYLDNHLPAAERRAFEVQLQFDPELQRTVAEMRQLYTQLASLPGKDPEKGMTDRFLEALQAEKKRVKPATVFLWRDWWAAAAAVLLLLGIGLGWVLQNNRRHEAQILSLQAEMRTTQRMMVLATLDKPSASERIRAVNLLQKEHIDPEMVNALVKTMNFDDMVNVRMKAAQALAHFGADPVVKDALIHSLATQESPEVQIVIIDILVSIGEKRAVPVLEELSRDQERMEVVRQKATSGIQQLI